MPEKKSSRGARRYVALLRGINVGGHKKVPMADLRACLEALSYENVKTLLNSGNAAFDTSETNQPAIARKVESAIEATFGFEVGVILRRIEDIQRLVDADPFKSVRVTPDIRLNVSFARDQLQTSIQAPYESADKALRIVRADGGDICSVVTLSASRGTVDAMDFVAKPLGKGVTTRTWNTVVKIAAL